jgi:glucose-6-phosphate 1-dehydrogenase
MENPENQILVIFGATGDLVKRMLIPAIFSLKNHKLLPDKFAVIGVGRTELTTEQFRNKMKEGISNYSDGKVLDADQVNAFCDTLSYISIDIFSPPAYVIMKSFLTRIDKKSDTAGNCIFYMAIPPNMYQTVTNNLSLAGLCDQSAGFRRIVIEKPFGYDYVSAKELNRSLHELFAEEQLYRIDHYLGKETVQNLLVTRFANGIFEPLWNRNYIQRVEITSAESIGIENRGRYFDSSGTLRDMVQNHLFQIVGLTAMEPPSSMDSDAIRNEILKVFQSFKPIREEDVDSHVIRGQYTSSRVKGEFINGYRHEKDVDPKSRTETYVAIKFYIDNWRWGGVPFYIRSGKRLPTRVTEIVIHFKPTPFLWNRKI